MSIKGAMRKAMAYGRLLGYYARAAYFLLRKKLAGGPRR